jgi:uncharacterized protein (UPF0332 family)
MDREAASTAIALFERRGQLDEIEDPDGTAPRTCLERATSRLTAASVLLDAELWESAFTTAYDAFRTAADAILLGLGYRVPATAGGHRIAIDIAHAAVKSRSDAFAPATAERFRQGRHESEYFDPARPIDKTADDATWARDLAASAITAAVAALSST